MAELPVREEEKLTPEEQAEKDRKEAAMAEARKIALQILTLTRNGLFVSLRFMDVALCQFEYVSAEYTDLPFDIKSIATTGEHMVYEPRYVIQQYMRDKKALSRDYLHIVLHCVFRHPFVSTHLNRDAWNLACDIAVEATICELGLRQTAVREADSIEKEINNIREHVTQMNAEHLYRYLLSGQATQHQIAQWTQLFKRDEHDIWWEIARQVEEEKKRQAEEEAEQQDEGEEPQDESDQDEEDQEDEEKEQNEEDDESGDDEGSDESDEDDEDGEEESDEEGEEDSESEESEDENGEDQDESGDSDESDEDQESQEDGDEGDESDEDGDSEDEDEFEDEYVSSPGGGDEGKDPSQGDPDSETHESEEESSGEGEGGGNPGEDPEQTDEEGADRENETPADNLTGQDDGHKPKDDKDKNQGSGDLSGQTDNGIPDTSDDPFGEQNQQGNADEGGTSGGIQKDQGSKSGEHSAGSGGGGQGSQSAWQHEGGATERSDGEKDTSDMRQLDGGVDPNDDIHEMDGEKSQEAKPEKGTKDTGEDSDKDAAEKNPSFMHNGKEQEELENKWKDISERMLVDLETSSKEWGDKSDSMVQSLKKINRDKYDYRTFLQKFSTLKEDIQINDDEFDYIYYTYGLDHYGNMPLIEPLEYKEVKKVRDFVIAIDTSGSCAGDVVQKFLDKTYSIFSQQENFFKKINLHIIQCDATIQSDVKITNKEEFNDYMKNLEFKGFGGTDFRPVFEYVNQMIEHNEFDDLKGLIYFTDGNGTYPQKRPPYETAFVFVDDDEFDYEVPSWAMKLVLETSDITEEVLI